MITDSRDTLDTGFAGRRWPLFGLALWTGLLTVLTLGLYRFWMKTRLRRWYWSAVRPGGHPMEYTGDPFEKLLGFLIAVVILAFYIGVVNLLLMFASFSLFQGNGVAYLLSFVGVIPLWFYAQYRARRYVLARTRWRGLRFGLEPGAWGYAWRALVHWLLTIVSAGLLLPRMTFWLEKYKTDRTFYGTGRLVQGGRWTMLYGSMKPLFLSVAFGIGATVAIMTGTFQFGSFLATLSALLGLFGIVHYRVDSLRRLTDTKELDGVGLQMTPSSGKVFLIGAFGYFLAALAILIPAGLLAGLIAVLQFPEEMDFVLQGQLAIVRTFPPWLLWAISAAAYFTIFLLWSALTHSFVTMPVIRHYALRLRVTDPKHLDRVHQRPRDSFEDAEGFAEALDVGASL